MNPTGKVVDLQPGGIDLAIRYGSGEWPGLESEVLMHTPTVVVAARCLVGDGSFEDPERLADFPWMQEYGTDEISAWFESQGVRPPPQIDIAHLPGYMLLEGLRNGDGISIASKAFIQPLITSGALRVLCEKNDPGYGFHMVTLPGVKRGPLKVFMSWLRTQAARDGAVAGDVATRPAE